MVSPLENVKYSNLKIVKEEDLSKKTPEIHNFLKGAFFNHFLFAKMAPDVVETVIDGMKSKIIPAGTVVIQEGIVDIRNRG